MKITLTDLIAPSFYGVHRALKEDRYTHYWLKGGRGSTKSSVISVEIILGMMKDINANAVAMRKVKETLRESVFEQLAWAIEKLGVAHLWDIPKSKLELTYLPTGQKILFRGADNPKKIKSTKVSKGYFKYVWYEEIDEFGGMEEIRTINQSLLRGGSSFVVFYSYNPPKSQRNWVNAEVTEQRDDRLVHHSTYLTVPRQWLGEQFFVEAEHLKLTKPDNYKHEYLGEVTGTGGEVFRNLTFRRITDEEIAIFDRIKRGLDFGYAKDPLHYAVMHFDKTRRRLFIFHEIHKVRMNNRTAVTEIKKENTGNRPVTADSAESRTVNEFRELGLNIVPAKKGPDSVEHGIKFLEDLEEIIIDPERCPNTKREFYGYELERDSNGNFKAGYPDKDNHSIDAVRYALEDEMRSARLKVGKKSALGVR
ncbi:PBSX family phage terminase large subunit [Paenibacillus alvei]|uniref:PBSX family phage terminase large subunit n=1 Tax=Paenibacillus alvei TaxID=44250 RepID=UPI000288763B|nr:PBSX family phage terminase large subunit [Paenibacillus alvei]EJW14296.1 phage terminase, large subunit, PBSX family [Paenibacillus alvei DSM 29]MCY9539221.1 PBSX family phage terminase large subunit [Paenibacillus alvei]MCY9706733.1 PBSX family phage terminase large subunit [Paenibacillus alvei]MCY9737010.1 PBSX family phage terminase large subunit [Paenibacillus alvei]MCY9758820.1 PBSX family phage terminase large subunit [Paenibacillus alvei]